MPRCSVRAASIGRSWWTVPISRAGTKILQLHAKKVKLSADLDLAVVAAKTPGFVGADLANIVNEAALLAARQDKQSIEMAEFDEAIDRVVAGLQKKSHVINPKEKKTVAYHESGHALLAELVPGADPVSKISIIPRGIAALGYTTANADGRPLSHDPFRTARAHRCSVGRPGRGRDRSSATCQPARRTICSAPPRSPEQ